MVNKIKRSEIHTKNLVLASLKDSDQEEMILLLSNPLIKKTYMLPDFTNHEEAELFYKRLKDVTNSNSHYSYGIFHKESLIGFINDVSFNEQEIEVGFFISPSMWNKGYATEALAAMIVELKRIGFKKVIAGHFEDNHASGKVMQKCGMKKIDKTEIIEYHNKRHLCLYYEI